MKYVPSRLIGDHVTRDALGQPIDPDIGHLHVSGGVQHDKTALIKQSELDYLHKRIEELEKMVRSTAVFEA